MRASRVRPGALVRDDAGQLQVVVKLRHIGSDLMTTYATFASGREEEWGPSADVEVVRLTPAQTEALNAVGQDCLKSTDTPPYAAKHSLGVRAPNAPTIDKLFALDLIENGERERWYTRLKLTPLGRALLDTMKEKG